MKIKKVLITIGVLLAGTLFVIPGLSLESTLKNQDLQTASTINPSLASNDSPVLQIQDITGGFGVHGYIHNLGSGNATNVSWSIVFNGGFVLFGRQTSDLIPGVDNETAVLISSGWVFGFGRPTVTFTVTCDEGSSASVNVTGTLLAFFYVGVK
jgi:hypothetical protein